jgi:hypothetical protein
VILRITANLFNNAEAGNPGDLLSVPVLNASTYGSGGSWMTTHVQKFSVAVPNLGAFRTPVSVAGMSYGGSGSRSWDYDHSVDVQTVSYLFPSGQTRASTGLFLKPGPNGTWTDIDFVWLKFGSQFGVGIPVEANVTYWMSLQYDSVTGLCSLAVFDPATFVQIGVTSVVPPDRNEELFSITFGANQDSVTTDAHTFFNNIVLDWTEAKFPLLPR